MGHDATLVKFGNILSNVKDIVNYDYDPSLQPVGCALRAANDGSLSTIKAAGSLVGINLGRSLSDIKKTAVCLAGHLVPVLLQHKRASGTVTITNYNLLVSAGDDTVTIGETTFTASSSAVTPGQATFRAATNNDATATSLAAQINAHATAGALVKATASTNVVTIKAIEGGVSGNEIALAYSDEGTSSVGATVSGEFLTGGTPDQADFTPVKGAYAYVNDVDGHFDSSSFGTITNAIYVSAELNGQDEDGNIVPAALIDMFGGL